jgi:predicted helicase
VRFRFDSQLIITLLYRPFFKVPYYSEKGLSDRLTSNHFAIFGRELRRDNLVICFSGPNGSTPFSVLATDLIQSLDLLEKTQCLPLYRYAADGERMENITDWALEQFRQHYQNERISRDDIFHYVYAVLHHPAYCQKYALNLRREFPRIPFYEDFRQWAKWGKQLMQLHLAYEQAKPSRLVRKDRDPTKVRQAVTPRLLAHKESVVIEVDTLTTLRGVPPEAWDYRLGTYTALEWVLERYKERAPRDQTIRERFNTYRFADYKEHVIDLLRRVCTVSVETMKIVRQMPP